ncbi:MAG: hypothetical protein JSV91_14180 [Phycisphaerales bacterium]|nr:MAG: hypothetical protein JSV91_14180 [Phycisphaerales bacterium]
MRGSINHQSNQDGSARRKQNRYLPVPLAGVAKSVLSPIVGYRPVRAGLRKVVSLIAVIAFVLLAGGGINHRPFTDSSGDGAQTTVNTEVASVAPVADWDDDLLELLDTLMGIMAEAKDVVDFCGCEGPLDDPARSDVEDDLIEAEAIVVQILDPLQIPTLTPTDAGSIDPSVDPTSLTEYADECVLLAEEAWQAAQSSRSDDEVIGTKLKTIESLLPAYRQAVGIAG